MAVAAFTLASCVREEIPHDLAAEPQAKVAATESLLTLSFEEPGVNPDTKSVINAADFDNAIKSVLVYLVSSDGSWKKAYSSSGNAGLADKEFTILADGSTYYDIYALVNMGEADFTPASPQNWVYTLPESFSSLNSTGLPMCGSARINANEIVAGGTTSKTLTLRRLLSKVNITVNKSGMLTGASDGSALAGGSLKLRQVSKVLRPFAAEADRRAQSTSEMYSADTDWHSFTGGSGKDVIDSGVTLYIPENRQGTGSGTTQADKTPAAGREGLATYLEYTATKKGGSDGVAGNLTYKAYLGENEVSDFNVIGDKVYTATLSLSWDGMWEGSWRVSQGDWADTRVLVISAAAGSTVAMDTKNTKAESAKVRKSTPTAFYMNYFLDGTQASTIQHGRKDMDSWPYGWVAYVDGNALPSGASGTIKNASSQDLIAWSYDSATDCLSMETVAGAPANSDIHTLQFITLDGRKQSDIVYFTTSIPFEFRWKDGGEPNHVAQRGILYAIDPDTGNSSSEAIIKLKNANSSQVRLTDNGDGTAVVELIDGFSSIENAIRIADSDDDRECLVPLEGRVPWFETGTIFPEFACVDECSNIRFTYLAAAADGSKTATALKVINNKGAKVVCAGENLDLDLVNELIAPVMGGGSSSSLLGYEYSPDKDGNLNIRVHIHTYEGVNALIGSNTNKTFTVGKTSLALPSVTGGHSQAADMQYFKAYNPWRLITSVAQGGVMEDYTLYNEPARDGLKMAVGWSSTPQNKPSQPVPNEWTTDIGNVIVKESSHIAYDASFQDGAGYLGSEVCSHVGAGPAAVEPDFSPSASTYYAVRLRVSDLSNYDWKTIGDYLWYDQGHYLTGVWVSPTATEAQRKQAVDDAFADGPVVLTGWHNTADAAWAHVTLPSGVTRSTPSAIDGAVFETYTRTETISSTWTLRYTMKDMTESQVKTHNAGKIDVVLRIINPFNDESPSLDKKVAEAYVKLHLYVWPAPHEVSTSPHPWCSVTGHGWTYSVFPYCYTGGKTVPGLDGRGFWSKEILLPATESYSTTFLVGGAASIGSITRDDDRSDGVQSIYGSATYQFRDNSIFSDDDSNARKMSKLMDFMSSNHMSGSPFTLRPASSDVVRNELRRSEPASGGGWTYVYDNNITYQSLNSVLGSATFYRANEYTLYYDPTGNERVYTYREGSHLETTDKLFVIHICGNVVGLAECHYFHPNWF
ncbi:MAG: DUF4906 domain-containing protein [Bacteroidales bacterium]|nr:DUF4906 domain-containing protein [Bacteroidales bacterium]